MTGWKNVVPPEVQVPLPRPTVPTGRCAFSDLTELEVYGAPAG